MPEDFEPTELADSNDFNLRARGAVVGGVQASETFLATSTGQRPLGQGGETMGIAKRDLDAFQQQVWTAQEQARVQTINRLKEIQAEIADNLSQVDPHSDQAKKYQDQIDNIDRKLKDKNFSISGYELMLPDHVPDATLDKAVALEKQAVKLANTAASVQPLYPGAIHVDSSPPRDQDPHNDLHLLSRAVASSKVDQLLGTNVLAEEKFGVDANNNVVGISVGVDGHGVIGDLDSGKAYFMDVDYSDHNVQKGLYDLEALDYITGQIDRHPGNIFIDPTTGKVKGIDNDLAFPGRNRADMLADDMMGEARSKPVHNKPLYMHSETAAKIESLSPDKLRQELSSVKYPGGGGQLSDAEIEGSVERLKEMQQHIAELRKQGRVVDQFDGNTYQTAIQHQQDAIQAQFKDQWAKPFRKNTPQPDDTDLGDSIKTSYLGSIEVERQKNEMGLARDTAEKLTPGELRDETGYSGKMARNPEYQKYAEKAEQALAQKKGEVRHSLTKAELKEINELQKDLAHYENRLNKLDHHDVMASIKSLRYGGMDGAKEAFAEKRLEAMQRLKEIDDEHTQEARQMLEGEKAGLMKAAKQELGGDDTSLNQSQGVNNAQSRKQSMSESQSSSKQSIEDDGSKQEVDDFDNALSELESDLEVDDRVPGVKNTGPTTTTTTTEPLGKLDQEEHRSVKDMLQKGGEMSQSKRRPKLDGAKDNSVRGVTHIHEDQGGDQTKEKQKQNVSKSIHH